MAVNEHRLKAALGSAAHQTVMLYLLVILTAFGFFDRWRAVAILQKQTAAMPCQSPCLNARARIQRILLDAALEGRRLAPLEVDTIARLFDTAEYPLATKFEDEK